MSRYRLLVAVVLAAVLAAACGEDAAAPSSSGETAREIVWDDLIPAEWDAQALVAELDVAETDDDDPRAEAVMARIRKLWDEAPVVDALDGERVRLPGFVVPLTADSGRIREFLLVPYYGACIHVPPPPANQMVHVVTAEGSEYEGELYGTVWVTGAMEVSRLDTEFGESGYRIRGAELAPYEEPVRRAPPPDSEQLPAG